jgi:2-methylcitrate dehydratase PrpD
MMRDTHAESASTASEELAAFVAGLRWEDVPPSLREKAKDHLLDTIGVACAGREEAQAHAIARVVQQWGGAPESSVIGSSTRLPAPKAAFVNALHARIHTFDDTYENGPAHPGNAVVSAALASAEATRASGRTLLTAIVAGYEVATRVSAALGHAHYDAGFHSTGTATPFGAAAAAARASGLDAARITGALGLAGEAAIGLRQYQDDGSMLDTALNGARGAETGVAAAAFAAAGTGGPRGVLDGRFGVIALMRGGAAESVTMDLGERWHFADTTIKPYASCRYTHGPVAALLAARLDPQRITDVEIAAFDVSVQVSNRPQPRDRMEAILSHQLAAALALLGRPIVPAAFEAPDAAVRALAARVRVRHDPALDATYPERWPHRIVVTLDDGSRVQLDSERPPAADTATVRAKFRALAAPVLGHVRAEAVIAAVDDLYRAADVQALCAQLRPVAERSEPQWAASTEGLA